MLCRVLTPDGSQCGRSATEYLGNVDLCWQHAKWIRHTVEGQSGIHSMRDKIRRLEDQVAECHADPEGAIARWQRRVEGKRRDSIRRNSSIYFAHFTTITDQHPAYGLIKIGRAHDVTKRMKDLGTEAIVTMPGADRKERELHRQFSHLLAWKREWFRPDADLLALIDQLKATG